MNEKSPSTMLRRRRRCIGVACASALSTFPTRMPAAIQPIVPSTRMSGNSFAGSLMWWNEIELVSDSVGM